MTCMTAARPTSPAPHRAPSDGPRLGLRERKKIKTREAIRGATYALIEEQGYDATTIDQIADRAEVSPSTVFRYFSTKEDIVLTDEYDLLMADDLRARPAGEPLLTSLRYVMRRALDQLLAEDPAVTRVRTRLMAEVPAVRSRMYESMADTSVLLREVIAQRSGLDAESLEVRVYAMSVVGGLMEVSLYWGENGGPRDGLMALVDRALKVMEHGLPGVENR